VQRIKALSVVEARGRHVSLAQRARAEIDERVLQPRAAEAALGLIGGRGDLGSLGNWFFFDSSAHGAIHPVF
jgi:hypothetical protein